MSKAKDQDQSPQPFALRRGIDGHPGWGGIRRRGDPGAIPVGKSYLAENVRFDDDVSDRPGLTKIVTTTPTGEAFGLKEYGLDVARGAILIAHHYAAEMSGYGLDWSPTVQDLDTPEIVKPTTVVGSPPRKSMCVLKDSIYFVGQSGSDYYLYQLVLPEKGTTVSVFRKYGQVAKFPTDRVPHHLAEIDGKLWIGCYEGRVCRFDGESLTEATEDAALWTANPVMMVGFRENVYAVGYQEVKKYIKDDEWLTVTFNPPGITGFVPMAVQSINDYIYAVGSANGGVIAIVRWDGMTWTDLSPAPVDAYATDIWGAVDLCEFNGAPIVAFNRRRDDPPERARVFNADDQTEEAYFGVGDAGIITSIVESGGTLYAIINEDYGNATSTTRLLRLDNASTVVGHWQSEVTHSQWTLLKTWAAYGPQPAPEMISVLPL
jgi:hypothetical protein